MGERDWAAEARERWPGCDAYFGGHALSVEIGGVTCIARPDGGAWCCNDHWGHTPIAAIEAAIRAEQDEARATLARLAVWRVDQPEAVGAAGVVLL